jgi:hypothetical protein
MRDPFRGEARVSRQINLFSAAFRPKPKRFSATWTVTAVAAITIVMLADYAWESSQLQTLRTRRSEAGAQLKQLQEQLITLGQSAQKTRSKALEEQLVRAEALLQGRQELFARLQSGEIGNRTGYAAFLSALARQHLEGVWLTGVEVSGPGSDFALEGRTVRADLLPGFIKMLRNEDALRGKSIGTLALHEREIDVKGDLKPRGVPAAVMPVQGEVAGQPAPAGVRVVEFRIGTNVAAPAGAAAGPAGAGR